jgi:DNA repair protein RadB
MVLYKRTEKISAGSYDLNKWLYGGYEAGVISMVAGPPSSGKTNFVLLAACSLAKKGKRVIFIDTEGGFSVERVRQIVGEGYSEILENILLLEPTNFDEQKGFFEKLLKTMKKEHAGLIVVDSMAMLYRLELGDAIKDKDLEKIREINREVAKQMRNLAEIARKQNIPVIVTNQVYTEFLSDEDILKGEKRKVNLVGGDLLTYWSKCILELKKDGNKRKVVLLKHRSLKEKQMTFEIKDKGIFKRSWI